MKKTAFVCIFTLLCAASYAQQTVVAVFPFEARSGTSPDDANTVTEVFNIKLQATGALRTVGRNVIDNVIRQEHIYQMSDFASDEKTAQLKQGLNADWVVYGVVTKLGRTFVITATLIDLNTNETMGGVPMQMDSIEEAFEKMDAPITEMIQRLTGGSGARAAVAPPRPRIEGSATGITIEVSSSLGGILYFQGEEVATLWDNETHAIPIERPGTYTVKMVFNDGNGETRVITISTRGVTKLEFYGIGSTGPGGGMVFFAENGRYMEVSGILGAATWSNALILARNYQGGGYSDWRLPSKEELNLVYQNLRAKNIGNLGDSSHWSSSEGSVYVSWNQRFSDGSQYSSYKDSTSSVRVVRAF